MMCGLIYHDVLPHRRCSGRLLAGRLAQVWALRVLERAPYGRLGCHAAGTAASRGMQQSLERYRHVCRCGGSVCSRGTGLYAQAYSSIQPLYLYSSIQMLYLCTCHYTEAHTAEVCISACLGWLVAIHLPSPSKYSSVKQQCLIPLV
jgi:hypothetical protein